MQKTTWDELLVHQSTAASTLDLLRRLPDDGADASAIPALVRDEMVAIALQEATRQRGALPRVRAWMDGLMPVLAVFRV
ncbi:hypothetical protein PINS_up014461 [Pythium insidiosum]|nr:hypothetical protein PINS_up014461 [Pythium insidiosum]